MDPDPLDPRSRRANKWRTRAAQAQELLPSLLSCRLSLLCLFSLISIALLLGCLGLYWVSKVSGGWQKLFTRQPNGFLRNMMRTAMINTMMAMTTMILVMTMAMMMVMMMMRPIVYFSYYHRNKW